jgi:site-specific DNA-methyltransferase (adenine-specific)
MTSKVLFSSQSEDWATPQDFFYKLNASFQFQLDACASVENAKCSQFYTKDDDALAQSWHWAKSVWMNPPYGRTIGSWMQKAYNESLKGCIVVCLVHARTDTRWWHDWVKDKAQVWFDKGRLKFGGSKNSAPFPSAVIVYGLDLERIVNGTGN